MAMTPSEAVELAKDHLIPAWQHERTKLDRIDAWARWDHDPPHKPRQATSEYRELAARSQAPWGDLVVSSVAQTLYIEGYRRPSDPEDSSAWTIWQANGMDGHQVPINRATLTYGYSFGLGLPGRTLTGDPMPLMRGVSPREMVALYDDPAFDEWPLYAARIAKHHGRYSIWVYDDTDEHRLQLGSHYDGTPTHISSRRHGAGVCPVVRFKNRFDLEGRLSGEIEPFIPVLGSIDQTQFDRLVVQRFASWIVRTIAGMDLSETTAATGESTSSAKMRLKVEDLLVAADKDTKFGSLPATPMDGFIKAHDTDLVTLAATSQTPAFELLGQMANMSAEALAAAKASQTAKSEERKHTLGEDYEQFIRLACHIAGDADGAADFDAQVRWADTTIRSLAQAVDAYGKLTQMLGFPAQELWPKIPGLTQQDVDEAKRIAEESGALDQLMAQLVANDQSAVDNGVDA